MRTHPTPPPLAVRDLGQRYGRKWALRACTFELRPNVVTALVGPNGAGKSTLMAAAAGLLQPTEGTIEVEGKPVTGTPAHANLGYLAQEKPLYRQYSIRDMAAIARRLNRRWDERHCDQLIAEANLDPSQRVATLSGGQRTRLALALVLARRPSVLLLDEPLADLDPLARREVAETVMAEVADTGMTVLLSSHILTEVVDLAEDIVVMGSPSDGGATSGGRITLAGPIEEIVAEHRVLTGPASTADELVFVPADSIVEEQHAARQTTILVRGFSATPPPGWTVEPATLDDVILAHLRTGRAPGGPKAARSLAVTTAAAGSLP